MSKKRTREKRDVNVQLVEIFEDLASENNDVRVKAARLLLARDSTSHDDVLSTFRRLVRGLCSGRKAARPGFSMALTEFLVKYASGQSPSPDGQSLHHEEILQMIRKQIQLSGDATGQEARDHYFGKVFAAEAVILSKVLFQSDKHNDTWSATLDLIFEVAQEKLWLRRQCGWVLLEALRTLQGVSGGDVYAQSIIDRLQSNGLWKSLEGVALWIAAQDTFPALRMPDDIFRHSDPLSRSERPMLIKILKQTDATNESGNDQMEARAGVWTSNLHFAWEIIFASCMEEVQGRVLFNDLWKEVVDEGIFAHSSSQERKHRGFLLVQRHIIDAPANKVPVLLGKNFIRCLVNQYSQKERYLHAIAERTVKAIQNRAASDGQAAFLILQTLVVSRGHTNFDNQTKSKFVDKLLRELPLEFTKDVIQAFGLYLIQPGIDNAKHGPSKRHILADYLLLIVRSLASPLSDDGRKIHRDAVETALDILVPAGYVDYGHAAEATRAVRPIPPFTEQDRQIFRSRILSCLTHLISVDPDPAHHPYRVAQALHVAVADGYISGIKADEEVQQVILRSGKTLSKLHAKASSKKDRGKAASYSAFELLFSLNSIQACSGEADAAKILEELQDCYKSLIKHKSAQDKGSEIVALMEIILTLVSKPSLLFRRIAQQVFSTFAPSISEEGLECMFDILEAKESIEGQRELFDEEGEDDEVAMDDADASDVEEVESGDSSSGSAENAESDGSEADSGPEEDAEMDDVDKKLEDALGTRRADADAAIAESESSDEAMDDEQMAALDPIMANIFQERNKRKQTDKKKEQKVAKENIVQFKCRVLELLLIYIKQQSSNPIALSIIMPLLVLIRSTSNKQVSQKACDIIREFLKLYKLKVDGSQEKKALRRARKRLPGVHDLAVSPGQSNACVNACSQASLLLVKVILSNGGTIEEAWAQYSKTGGKIVTDSRCKVLGSLYQDWWNWYTSARTVLRNST